MLPVFLNVAPVFILILLGWSVAKARIMKPEAADALGDFVFRIGLPLLIFRTLSTADFDGSTPFRLWIAYFMGVIVTWTCAHLLTTRVFKRDAKVGVVAGLSASFANNVFIGIPLVKFMIGSDGLVALSILLVVHLPIMMMAGTVLMERAVARTEGVASGGVLSILRQVGRNLVRNPLVWALGTGLASNLLGVRLPVIATTVIDQLAVAASPLALLSIGMTLSRYAIRGDVGLTSTTAVLKLLLLPAVVFLVSRLLGLPDDWTAALVLTSSVPTGVNAWLLAGYFRTSQNLAASVIGITTALGVVSVSVWAWLLGN